MITDKEQLKSFIKADSEANGRRSVRADFFGDEIWKFQLTLRKLEYYSSLTGTKKLVFTPIKFIYKYRFHRLSLKLGFSIPINVFDKGLSIPHYGSIVVAKGAEVGKNCRIHEGVNIGATNGTSLAPKLGDRIFIGSGAKILGDITVADDVAIGANAVVVKSITEPGTTWGGVPAKKISDKGSQSNIF